MRSVTAPAATGSRKPPNTRYMPMLDQSMRGPNDRAQPRASARRLQRAVGRATGIERPGCKHHLPVCTLRFLATLSWERNDRAETCPVKFRAIRPNELRKRELAGAMPGCQPLDLPLVPKR